MWAQRAKMTGSVDKPHCKIFANKDLINFVLADTGYGGNSLAQWTQAHCGWHLETPRA